MTFVLTGTLPTLSRSDARALIEKAGHRCARRVSKQTTFLVAGDLPGSKAMAARHYGVQIIGEPALLALLRCAA